MKRMIVIAAVCLLTSISVMAQDKLYIDDFTAKPGEEVAVKLNLTNPANSYCALQFDLFLPTGVSIVEDEGFYVVEPNQYSRSNNDGRTVDHSITVAKTSNGAYRFIISSNLNSIFKGTSGEICTITLAVGADVPTGVYDGSVKDAKAVFNTGDVMNISDASFKVKIAADTRFQIATGVVYSSGQKLDFDNISLTFGEAGGNDFTENEGYVHNGVNGNNAGGSFYLFEPKEDGVLSVDVSLNAWKVLNVLEDGTPIEGISGLMVDQKYNGKLAFEVKAGRVYKMYAYGSKLGFAGFTFPGELTPLPTNVNEIGQTFSYENINYSITSLSKNTVEVVGGSYSGTVNIPKTTRYANADQTAFRSFTVTGIADGAFANSSELTEVLIPTSVSTIGNNAFAGCNALMKVTALAANPAVITASSFPNSGNIILYVPAGCVPAYKAADYWKDFKDIREIVTPTDIAQLDNVIYMDATEVRKASQAVLSFKMKNSVKICAFQFDLCLPEGVTVVKDDMGIIEGTLSDGRLPKTDNHALSFSELEDGVIRFLCTSSSNVNFVGNEGEIATLNVNIADDMTEGDYAIRLKDIKLVKDDGEKLYTEMVQSKLTVASYIPGDANGDGEVDVADVVAIVNYILNKPGEIFNEQAADVNEDGVIDVADVVAVVNIILKGGKANSPEAKAHARAYLKAHGFIVP